MVVLLIKPICFIGRNSLGFNFLCGGLPIVASLIAKKVYASQHVVIMLILWSVCVIVAYFIVLFINKWLPWLWDLRVVNNKNRTE